MRKRILALLLAALLCLSCGTACSQSGSEEGARLLSFSQANSVDEMQALNGKTVTIIGYMSTLSPVSGQFVYLMNLPYQSCPFCVPNTTELSNTMAVYAKDGKEFEFTDQAIQVTGTMDFGDYVDEFGYMYSYRIKDASFTVLDTSDMSEQLKLWQQLASTDVISDVYTMFEYLNFLCAWPTYTAQFDGESDYLYPSDALYFLETEGAQYNYGFQDGYFQQLVASIRSVDETAFEGLVQIVEAAEALSRKAYDELKAERYTTVPEYSGDFGDSRTQYRLELAEELEEEMAAVFYSFSAWLSEWEL